MPPVIFIMIDGLRPDAIAPAVCPNLKNLLACSAYTLSARSVMPSITLPCHTSIFHSVTPERHGITTNDWHPMARPLPGLMEVAHAAGKHGAFFFNWEQLRDLSRPGSLRHIYFRDNSYTPHGDLDIAHHAAGYIRDEMPDFAFVYFGTVDAAGHYYGWMSEGYMNQINLVDQALGTLLNSLPERSTILLQSDHGGHERTHGTASPEDMTIPWLVSGPGLRQDYEISSPLSLLDTAPTLAHLLGLNPHPQWEGRVVTEIFE
ncbi:MAG: alkaline phosphatase family protein [Anaerolineales bacterium]|jgi:predicted AlkP superfamily pyrophosphatase or phosphodiesterase|nr:alkaline phosphatase family protein [Anaerolineales bacterium]